MRGWIDRNRITEGQRVKQRLFIARRKRRDCHLRLILERKEEGKRKGEW